jgi:PAS domain S-box-containing protein
MDRRQDHGGAEEDRAIEAAPGGLAPSPGREELAYRLRQQEILTRFSLHAFGSDDPPALLDEACRRAAEGLGCELSKVLAHVPARDHLLTVAGIGWKPGVVGRSVMEASPANAAGHAFLTGEAVASTVEPPDSRFEAPEVLVDHGVERAINARVPGAEGPFGVLEVDTTRARRFAEADLTFVQGLANLLGAALERRRMEGALRESEGQFRLLADAIPQLAWMAEPTGSIDWFNRRWYAYTGTTPDAMRGWGWRAVHHPDHVDAVSERFREALSAGESWEDTFPLRGADGAYRWFLSRAMPIRDEAGRIVRWFGTNTDVTEVREAAERQRLLTQEVSHRVKNSLQLVASLLGLQSRASRSEEAARALDEAQARVQAVAQVHDRLWRQYDAKRIDLCGFLDELCQRLDDSAPNHRVEFRGASSLVSVDRAIPTGLLVNELVTNALKYAYCDDGGAVRVTLARPDPATISLEVADEGRGLPEDYNLSPQGQGLGTRLLNGLARQLGRHGQRGAARPRHRLPARDARGDGGLKAGASGDCPGGVPSPYGWIQAAAAASSSRDAGSAGGPA